MKIVVVRHAEKGIGGLSLKGQEQAKELAKKLAGVKIDVLYCSPALRAEKTMDILLQNREENIQIAFTRLVGPKKKKESLEKLKFRLKIFMEDLEAEHTEDQTIVIITHQMVVGMMMHLRGMDVAKIGNAEFLEI